MVTAVVISSIVFLAVDLTCRRLDIMLLEVEIALEVKVTCKEEDVDCTVDKQDGRHWQASSDQSASTTSHVLNSHFGDYSRVT